MHAEDGMMDLCLNNNYCDTPAELHFFFWNGRCGERASSVIKCDWSRECPVLGSYKAWWQKTGQTQDFQIGR